MIDTIEVVIGFPRHRKTRRLERILGNDARWVPVYLWLYTIENARVSGDLSHLTADDLAAVLDYHGDATALRAALVTAGFLDDAGMVVGWSERYAQRFAFYERRAKLAADRRWGKQDKAAPDASSITQASPSIPQQSAPPPPSTPPTSDQRPDLTGPDLTLGSIAKHSTSMLQASRKHDAAAVCAVYDAYPRKVGKAAALKAIDRAIKSGAITADTLLAKVQAYAAAVATWPEADRQFIPHPATWVNAGRYEDDPTTWQRKTIATSANSRALPASTSQADTYARLF